MIGIKMDMPESCDNCKFCIDNGYLTSQCRFHFQTVEDLRLNKVDKDCPLVDLGSEDMSWEELVGKCKDLKGIYEITVFPTYITFGILFTQFYFQKNGYMVVDQNSIKKIGYSQMYQIIKSLVGDER